MKKKALRLLVFLPTIAFLWCAQSANASTTNVTTDITVPTTWKKESSPYVISKAIYIKAPLTIEPGVIVKLYDADKSDNYGTALVIKSDFTAIGTADEKIVFTSFKDDSFGGDTNGDGDLTIPGRGDWDGIGLSDNPAKLMLDNVVISYASYGVSYESVSKAFYRGLTVKNSEIKNNYVGLNFRNVTPLIENNIISDNKNGIATFTNYSERVIKINNNSIFNNQYGINAVNPAGPFCTNVDATYNWWGDTSGPQIRAYAGSTLGNPGGTGDMLYGSCIRFDPWFRRSPDVKRDPIILVPGIGASINPDLMIGSILNDNWKMFDRTYDGLIRAIRSAGYVEGKDFFIAYYDWRKSNAESAENFLKPVIKKALALNPVGQVNIIAHSMGGLVARSYVQSNENDDVNNLILVATPSKGSSDAYALWEGGYVPSNWAGRWQMNWYINYLRLKNLTLSPYKVVHQFIPSLKDLLPTYSYLHPTGSSQNLKDYLSMNEKNDFLINLNSETAELNQKTIFSIILGNDQPTVNKIPIVASDTIGIWQDGKPFPIDPEKTDEKGDGRVLLTSGDIQSEFKDVLPFDHGDVVSEAEPIIMARLNETPSEVYHPIVVEKEIVFWSEGPGDMKITDPTGKTVTKDSNISNDVADSKFSSESKPDGFKIASIPNPKKGNYTVKIDAPQSGKFYAGVEFADNNDGKNDSSSTISGTIEKNLPATLTVSVDPTSIEKPSGEILLKDEIEPIMILTSPKSDTEYLSNQILPITFSILDEGSTLENMKIVKYLDGKLFAGDSIDLSIQTLGWHNFRIDATDEAGNRGVKSISFKIKKFEPPIVVVPPIIVPAPIIPPIVPVALPILNVPTLATVLGTTTVNPVVQKQSIAVKKTSKKKAKSKKKKTQTKKVKKVKVSKASVQLKKVLGISTSKIAKQKNTVTNAWSKVKKNWKDWLLKPLKYFKK